MKNVFTAAVISMLALSVQADVIPLDAKAIDLGNISNAETNMAVIKDFSFTRTADTPKKVTIKYEVNFLKEDCTQYEVQTEEIPEFKKVVCEASNGGSFLCEEKIFSGLYNAKTECVAKGSTRLSSKGEVVLNFSKAVKLAPGASEVVSVNLSQKNMNEESTKAVGRVEQSHSLYEVKNSRFGKNQINYKAL
ncbi:MAG: hypothetical protein CME71_00440 [Halobacteriovorax sp.]|nr:hypothetical protein [Halobacteriovorax sp.]